MASRTQLRLSQITGSFGTTANGRLHGAIHDYLTAAASGSIVASDLSGSLSHIASSIKRIHGFSSFTQNAPGVLTGSAAVIDYGGTESNNFKIKDASENDRITFVDILFNEDHRFSKKIQNCREFWNCWNYSFHGNE